MKRWKSPDALCTLSYSTTCGYFLCNTTIILHVRQRCNALHSAPLAHGVRGAGDSQRGLVVYWRNPWTMGFNTLNANGISRRHATVLAIPVYYHLHWCCMYGLCYLSWSYTAPHSVLPAHVVCVHSFIHSIVSHWCGQCISSRQKSQRTVNCISVLRYVSLGYAPARHRSFHIAQLHNVALCMALCIPYNMCGVQNCCTMCASGLLSHKVQRCGVWCRGCVVRHVCQHCIANHGAAAAHVVRRGPDASRAPSVYYYAQCTGGARSVCVCSVLRWYRTENDLLTHRVVHC